MCFKFLIESKLYHDRVAKYVSWSNVVKACVDDFTNFDEKMKTNKSKYLIMIKLILYN